MRNIKLFECVFMITMKMMLKDVIYKLERRRREEKGQGTGCYVHDMYVRCLRGRGIILDIPVCSHLNHLSLYTIRISGYILLLRDRMKQKT